jgi:hypothetical protein
MEDFIIVQQANQTELSCPSGAMGINDNGTQFSVFEDTSNGWWLKLVTSDGQLNNLNIEVTHPASINAWDPVIFTTVEPTHNVAEVALVRQRIRKALDINTYFTVRTGWQAVKNDNFFIYDGYLDDTRGLGTLHIGLQLVNVAGTGESLVSGIRFLTAISNVWGANMSGATTRLGAIFDVLPGTSNARFTVDADCGFGKNGHLTAHWDMTKPATICQGFYTYVATIPGFDLTSTQILTRRDIRTQNQAY